MLNKSGVVVQFRSVPKKKHRIIKRSLASKILFFWCSIYQVQNTARNTAAWVRYGVAKEVAAPQELAYCTLFASVKEV